MAIERWRPQQWGLSRRGSDPFRAFDEMFNRMFDDWLSPRMAGEARGGAPAVDVIDKDNAIVVRADLPGLTEKDIQVSVENGMLTVRGSRQEEREAKEEDYYRLERWSGSFSRTLPLPTGIDPDKIKATFKNGVLEIHVPKSQQAGKNIQIQAA